MLKIIFSMIFTLQFGLAPLAAAQSTDPIAVRKEDSPLKSGGIYYSANKKNELVIRTNIWGAVQYPGVHYIPMGTRFLEAISIAGGPLDLADTSSITLSSKDPSVTTGPAIQTIALNEALAKPENNPVLKPDDIIVIKQDRSMEKTQLWVNVGTFILSAIALGLLIQQNNKK